MEKENDSSLKHQDFIKIIIYLFLIILSSCKNNSKQADTTYKPEYKLPSKKDIAEVYFDTLGINKYKKIVFLNSSKCSNAYFENRQLLGLLKGKLCYVSENKKSRILVFGSKRLWACNLPTKHISLRDTLLAYGKIYHTFGDESVAGYPTILDSIRACNR